MPILVTRWKTMPKRGCKLFPHRNLTTRTCCKNARIMIPHWQNENWIILPSSSWQIIIIIFIVCFTATCFSFLVDTCLRSESCLFLFPWKYFDTIMNVVSLRMHESYRTSELVPRRGDFKARENKKEHLSVDKAMYTNFHMTLSKTRDLSHIRSDKYFTAAGYWWSYA